MRIGSRASLARSWIGAAACLGLYLLAGWTPDRGTGLVRTVVTTTHPQDEIDRGRAMAVSRGVWEVPVSGLYDLVLDGRSRLVWTIDDVPAIEAGSADGRRLTRTVWLAGGFHRVEIRQDVNSSAPAVAAAPTGHPPQPPAFRPRAPRNPGVHAALGALRQAAGWLAIATLMWSVAISAVAVRKRWTHSAPSISATTVGGIRGCSSQAGRAITWTVLAGILVHAALLRIDAISARYGVVSSPPWLAALQTRTIAPPLSIRRASLAWYPEPTFPHADGKETRYRSDPYTYLEAARTMTSFYRAHFREPVFPYVTKGFLRLLDDQDVAVSFASAFFSICAVWLTYVLGAALWSRPAGLLAALGLSLDYDVITQASGGWRDDAYMAMVTLCAYLLLRWWRTGRAEPRIVQLGRLRMDAMYLDAAFFGIAGGFAILTRIMAVSFLAAATAGVVVARRAAWRRHAAAAGLALVAAALVAAPYFVNCWRVYGDPLYTFNVHGRIYSIAETQTDFQGSTAGYVAQKIARRPFRMLDTVAQGLTTYPFGNKWSGLDHWLPGLGTWVSVASIAGLIVLAGLAEGRLLLVFVVSSLLPFSFTWTVDPDFRFTLHVYPILMIAAALSLGGIVRAIRALSTARRDATARRPVAWLPWASTVGLVLAVLWFVGRVSPSLVFAETLQWHEDASVTAGSRDRPSFERGWSELMRSENVSMRVAVEEGTLSIRLPEAADYPATLRMDPFPRPLGDAPGRLPVVEVVLNGTRVAEIPLRWTPARVGAYDIVLPRTAVRRGANRLVLRVKRPAGSPIRPGLSDGDAVGLWYLRVHPPPA